MSSPQQDNKGESVDRDVAPSSVMKTRSTSVLLDKISESSSNGGRYDDVMELLVKGADVSCTNSDGDNALLLAIAVDDADLVQLLIVFGADTNGKNSANVSPRHKAALSTGKNRDCSLYLLHNVGARRCAESMDGCNDGCSEHGTDDGKPGEKKARSFFRWMADSIANLFDRIRPSAAPPAPPALLAPGGRVLCLDGGGIRGLVLVQLLVAIEIAAGQPIKNCFDWIAGTSTGSFLAMAIANGKSLRYCLGIYFQLKDAVFTGSRPYDSKNLDDFLKKELGPTTTMTAVQSPRVILPAVMVDRFPAELHLFKNFGDAEEHPAPEDLDLKPVPSPDKQLVWEAVRSSGAAPTYFRQHDRFVDGGIMANNPTLDTLAEIDRSASLDESEPTVRVVVSLGTGRPPLQKMGSTDVFIPWGLGDAVDAAKGAVNLGKTLIDQVTFPEGHVVKRAEAWCHMIQASYFRFSPQLSKDVALDCTDDKELVNMLWETQCFIADNQDKINELANELRM